MNILKNNKIDPALKAKGVTPPTYRVISLKDLHVDKYQRKLNLPWCNEQVKEFDYNLIGIILVSFRGGRYYIIDGMHRKTILQSVGVETAMCHVLTGLTYRDESRLFEKYNTSRRALKRIDIFSSRISRNDTNESATRIKSILSKTGYTCERSPKKNARSKVNIAAVAELETAYSVLGESVFTDTMKVIHQTWAGDRSAVNNKMLSGMVAFMKCFHGDVDASRFVKKLKIHSPEDIIRQGYQDSKYSPTSNGKAIPIARVICAHYNKGLSAERRLSYDDIR